MLGRRRVFAVARRMPDGLGALSSCCPCGLFARIPTTLPSTLTVGGHLRLNNFCDLLREEISRAGYTEMLTHGLCSRDENFKVIG